jgi:hypothetical protein
MFAVWTGDTRVLISYFILPSSFFCWSVCRSHFFLFNILCRHIECSHRQFQFFNAINRKIIFVNENYFFFKLQEIHWKLNAHMWREGFCSLNGRRFVITWLYLNYKLSVSASNPLITKAPLSSRSLIALLKFVYYTLMLFCFCSHWLQHAHVSILHKLSLSLTLTKLLELSNVKHEMHNASLLRNACIRWLYWLTSLLLLWWI